MNPEVFCEMLDDLLERGWAVTFDRLINTHIAEARIDEHYVEQAGESRCVALWRVKHQIDKYQAGIDRAAEELPS